MAQLEGGIDDRIAPLSSRQMALSETERSALISRWIQPSSESEALRQDRAERMVREAINSHAEFRGVQKQIYAKGSYANNTNVRLDSDVDVVVQCDELFYYDFAPGVAASSSTTIAGYTGVWTPDAWRTEVCAALINHFGPSGVDHSGNVAILIRERPGSRPSTDVVPSFQYRMHLDGDGRAFHLGSAVHNTSGQRIVNWPQQQMDNGRARNDATGRRYKNYVRALKNAENLLCALGTMKPLPSYFMECLVWNAKNEVMQSGSLTDGFRYTLLDLWNGLASDVHREWVEPNQIKYLFHPTQKWTPADGLALVQATWKHLYG